MNSRLLKDIFYCLAAACTLLALQAHAQPYVGGSIAYAHQSTLCAPGAPCSNAKPALKLLAGYQVDQAWSGELSYLRASKFTASDSNTTQTWSGAYQAQVWGVSAGYNFSAATLQWQLRAGIASVQADFLSATVGVPNSSGSIVQPLLGFGLRHQVSPGLTLRVDLDATRSKAYTRSGNLSFLSIGLEQRF